MKSGKNVVPDREIIAQIFNPIIGLPCWGTKHITGTIISLEFGPVAQPERPSPSSLRRAAANPRANLPIRMLPPSGEWNFSLVDAAWTIKTSGASLDDVSFKDREIQIALNELNGQTLAKADWTTDQHLVLDFAEGARIDACISPRYDVDSDIWWLLQTHGVEAGLDGRGMLEINYPE